MKINDKIRHEKLQYNIKREAAKISTLSSGKIDNFECLTGEEKLPFGKAFEKQIKGIQDQGIKQIEALKALKLEEKS